MSDLTDYDRQELNRMRRKLDSIRGDGIANGHDTVTFSLPREKKVYLQPPTLPQIFHAKITAATAINGGIRWKYTIELGHWDMSSNVSTGGTWVKDSGTTTIYAFNSAEDMNTFTSGSGPIGTGNSNVSQSDGAVNGGPCHLVSLAGYVVVMFRGVDSSTTAPTPYYTIINAMNSSE